LAVFGGRRSRETIKIGAGWKNIKSLLNTKIIHGMVLKSRHPEEVPHVERNIMSRNIAAARI
ncbi:MAG: hypothetical protein J0I23_31385, partial [Rhizobiales bacterium]|nr:hypothetical protein [Hyphomicrobiales bacterium]